MKNLAVKSNIDYMNAIRSSSSDLYKERVPQATQTNLVECATALLDYTPVLNEFMDSVVNKIAMQIVKSLTFENKLKKFKKGNLPNGTTIEEIFVEIAKAQKYDVQVAEDEVFKRVKPTIKSIYHKENRQDMYKVTIQKTEIRQAILQEGGLNDLVNKIINSLTTGAEFDEFIITKRLFKEYDDKNLFAEIKCPKVTKETSNDFVTVVQRAVMDMQFPRTDFNASKVLQSSPLERIIIFMKPEVLSIVNVESLAVAFNMDKRSLMGQIVLLDDYGGVDAECLIVDSEWFRIYDVLQNTDSIYNPEGMYFNYFRHHHQVMSVSRFFNAIKITGEEPVEKAMSMTSQSFYEEDFKKMIDELVDEKVSKILEDMKEEKPSENAEEKTVEKSEEKSKK